MKKIIAGILGTLAVAAVVGGAAWALFFSSATVNNVAFSSGNADLKFADDDYEDEGDWNNSFTLSADLPELQEVYPGYAYDGPFWLKNFSDSAISLRLSGRLVSASGDWGPLSPVFEAWIGDDAGSIGSGWYSFADWNSLERDINITLAPDESKQMRGYFRVSSSAGNEIADKAMSTDWVITGTQVTP